MDTAAVETEPTQTPLIRAISGKTWNPFTDKNPDAEGTGSRNGFLFNCYHHPLGKFFQDRVKGEILKTISAAHEKIKCNDPEAFEFSGQLATIDKALKNSIHEHITHDKIRKTGFMDKIADIILYCAKDPANIETQFQNRKNLKCITILKGVGFARWGIEQYDPTAFEYGDERLQDIDHILKTSIPTNFENPKTQNLLLAISDICIFMMKEDIYYRPRWIQIIHDLDPAVRPLPPAEKNNPVLQILSGLAECCENMPLTPDELENIRRFH